MKLWGADHVLVGSDYPWDMGMYDPCGFVDGCDFLKDADKMKIMGLNAAKLLRITSRLRSMGIRASAARATTRRPAKKRAPR